MKTPLKIISVAIVGISLCALSTHSPFLQAQEVAPQQVAVPVVVQPVNAQYKVIDIGQIAVPKGFTPAATLEAILNEMGVQGWKVVTVSGNYVILAH
jgi:hypothetical protein